MNIQRGLEAVAAGGEGKERRRKPGQAKLGQVPQVKNRPDQTRKLNKESNRGASSEADFRRKLSGPRTQAHDKTRQ